jgi:nicotinate phosphoribosyltransferase
VVHALYDGDEVGPWETVILVEGPYDAFAHLETLYLGVLARRTRVGTNTRRVVEAAGVQGRHVLPRAPRPLAGADRRRLRRAHRRRHRRLHGRAGLVVGERGHRHRAARPDRRVRRRHRARHAQVRRAHARDIKLITLVDFENDCVRTSLEVADALGDRLYGVRLDTSEMLVDRSVIPQMGRSARPA